jgi:hypothetical protein
MLACGQPAVTLEHRVVQSPASCLHDLARGIDRERDAILAKIARNRVAGRNPPDQLCAGLSPDLSIIRRRMSDEFCRRRGLASLRGGPVASGRRACGKKYERRNHRFHLRDPPGEQNGRALRKTPQANAIERQAGLRARLRRRSKPVLRKRSHLLIVRISVRRSDATSAGQWRRSGCRPLRSP